MVSSAAPAALLDVDDADKLVGGVDQIESHGVQSLMERDFIFLLLFLNAGVMDGMSQ
jgi:hypothetical protein